MEPDAPLLIIDGGTTNTRLWAVQPGDRIVHEARVSIGARDGTTDEGREKIKTAVTQLVVDATAACTAQGVKAGRAIAAGMIGSAQGLKEVPHVAAPAGLAELAAGVSTIKLGNGTDLHLIPGVRFGPEQCSFEEVGMTDVVRGEEILCLGLLELEGLRPGDALINLGSHWKRLVVDEDRRLAESKSCLSGELLQAVSQHTILAGAMPTDLEAPLDWKMVELGADTAMADGFGRALYCVRLLSVRAGQSAEACRSFLVGAVLGSDLPPLLQPDESLAVVGRADLAQMVCRLADTLEVQAEPIDPADAERAFRTGIFAVNGLI